MIVIPILDQAAAHAARSRQARLTKPLGALGRLETLAVSLAAMTGNIDWRPRQPAVIVCAGDHGIATRGVSAYPQAVTQQMVRNFLNGGAAVNVIARQMNARVSVVDAGVIGDFEPHPQLVAGKIAHGTADFLDGPAMTVEQAEAAIQLGIRTAENIIEDGADILCVGEMGIGNTTSASAIIAALTHHPAHEVTGRGTGLDERGLQHKIALIETALALHHPAEVDTLAKLGGYEIGAMAGVIVASASARVPVIIDGLISTAAALIAQQMAPRVSDYLIAGHRSVEPGHRAALTHLGLEPLLDLEMRLGEGTGALLALPIVEAAMRTLQEMATFEQAGVSERDAG